MRKNNFRIIFKKINGKYKKQINIKNFNTYKNKTIGELLTLENDKKFKNAYINRNLYKKITKIDNGIFNNFI